MIASKRGHLSLQFFPHSFPQFVGENFCCFFGCGDFEGAGSNIMCRLESPESLAGLSQLTGVLVWPIVMGG